MLVIRCKDCNRELVNHPTKTNSCGCPNMTSIKGDKIFAVDLSKVVMVQSYKEDKKTGVLSQDDILWQEQRKKRKVRKLDFEVR